MRVHWAAQHAPALGPAHGGNQCRGRSGSVYCIQRSQPSLESLETAELGPNRPDVIFLCSGFESESIIGTPSDLYLLVKAIRRPVG